MSSYIHRWAAQVGNQLWSFGRDQIVGLILAALILVYQLKVGLVSHQELRTTELATLAYPYLTLLGLYVVFEILRAPSVLDARQQRRIAELTEERDKLHRELAEYKSPHLGLEFAPPRPGFLLPTLTDSGERRLYVRVLPVIHSPVSRCRGYLESIERLENGVWVGVGFASRPQLRWSEVWERRIEEVELYSGNTQFLDVGYLREGDPLFYLSIDQMPFHVAPVFIQYPRDFFKFGIKVVGRADERIVQATIDLQFQNTDQGPNVTKL